MDNTFLVQISRLIYSTTHKQTLKFFPLEEVNSEVLRNYRCRKVRDKVIILRRRFFSENLTKSILTVTLFTIRQHS